MNPNSGPYFAGIDMGSGFIKAVIMNNKIVMASQILPISGDFETLAIKALSSALSQAGMANENLQWIAVTGYGKRNLSFVHRSVSPLSAGAGGAHYFFPLAKTVIDVGVQQSSVVKLDNEGNLVDSLVSEKCAAGSGWFLKVVARVLGLSMEDFAKYSLRAKNPVTITTDCAVFAETEVISRVAEGNAKEDIIAGVHQALAVNVKHLVERIGITQECVLIGGTGKDLGFIHKLNKELGLEVKVPEEPQMAAAIGAILIAKARNRD
jgi:(R)-2-hydroxyacyl-CoA dehydratese activating ATPase